VIDRTEYDQTLAYDRQGNDGRVPVRAGGDAVPEGGREYDDVLSVRGEFRCVVHGEGERPNGPVLLQRYVLHYDIIDGSLFSAGDWIVVRYVNSGQKAEGHTQMDMGNGEYFDSTPYTGYWPTHKYSVRY